MAKQTIDIGSSPNKGDGDPLRTAFIKINQNFDELYAGSFADPESVGTNLSPDTDATYNLGAADKQWADVHISDFLYLNGQRIEALPNGALLVNGSGARESADIVGSVFADDSTLLVDAVNGVIPWSVIDGAPSVPTFDQTLDTTDEVAFAAVSVGNLRIAPDGSGVELLNTTNNIDIRAEWSCSIRTATGNINLNADDGTVDIDATGGLLQMNGQNGVVIGSALGDIELNAFDNAIIFESPVVGFVGDIKGSVFGDDSSLLVDAVNGKLFGDVVTTSITNSRDIDIASEDDVAIITSAGNNNYEWFFNSGGYLSFPPDGQLYFDGDAGITFSTVYDVAGSTAHIDIRDTGSTANLSIDNDAANGTIDITANGYVTIATDDDGTRYEFNFGADGVLTLPVGGSLSGSVSYSPSTDAHWTDPNPTTIADALDRLAAAIFAANGGSSI